LNDKIPAIPPTFAFIPATEADQPYLLALRKLTMVEHLARNDVHLTDQQHLERVQDSFHRARLIYLQETSSQTQPGSQTQSQSVSQNQNQDQEQEQKVVIGMLKYQQNDNDLKILQLQIHPDHQNKGYGKAVMQQILRTVNTSKVSLTVLKGNPAIHLYERLGFEVVGEDELEYWMSTM